MASRSTAAFSAPASTFAPRVERPHRPFRRVDRQHRGALEERRRGEATLARARPADCASSSATSSSGPGGAAAVPGPPIGVVVRVDHLGKARCAACRSSRSPER
jgi:hypothetical protein